MIQIVLLFILTSSTTTASNGWLDQTIYNSFFHKHTQDPKKRTSGYPFITGDTFRLMSDHICDETNLPFDPAAVKFADIIFVSAQIDILKFFFSKYHPLIKNPYILITHNEDTSVPGPVYTYLDDPKLLTWFAQNIDQGHPKLIAIPIGFSNPVWGELGNTKNYHDAMKNIPDFNSRENKAYMNFNVGTCPKRRQPVWDFFKNKPFVHTVSRRSHRQHLEDLKQFRFVISPPGNGIDCVRHWEALLMGCIPIIQHSPIDILFDQLPVILINNWNEVTSDFLNKKYEELKNQNFDRRKVLIDFWLDLIKNAQKKFREQKT